VSRLPPAVPLVVAGVALALVPALRLPAFYESFLYLVFFWISLATSWNILSGYAGYFSFGHAAFFGAGVYTTATLATAFDVPFLWTLPAAGLVAALLGSVIAAVVFRVRGVRGELFGLLTLAVTFVLSTIALNTRIDGGPGVFLAAVPVPTLFGSPAATLYHTLTQCLRLCLDKPFVPDEAPRALKELLARASDMPDFATLEGMLKDTLGAVHALYDRLVA